MLQCCWAELPGCATLYDEAVDDLFLVLHMSPSLFVSLKGLMVILVEEYDEAFLRCLMSYGFLIGVG